VTDHPSSATDNALSA